MPGQVRQPPRAIDLYPVSLTISSHTGLIPMLERTGTQHLGNARHGWPQRTGGALHPCGERSFGELTTVEICQEFTRSRQGYHLLLVQVHPQRADVWPVLHGSVDPSRKRPRADLLTDRATHPFSLMRSHHQVYQRYIMPLPLFLDFPLDPLERRLSVLARCRTMTHHLVWRSGEEQGVSGVSHLPT
jgi:hypothetical protein